RVAANIHGTLAITSHHYPHWDSLNLVGRTAGASTNRLARPVLRAVLILDTPPKRSIATLGTFSAAWVGERVGRGGCKKRPSKSRARARRDLLTVRAPPPTGRRRSAAANSADNVNYYFRSDWT